MIKLKKIISSLSPDVYKNIEDAFVKNKAGNFLYLLQAYRHNNLNDADIITYLDVNSNSFYVLKSRLYDKIQDHLSGDIYASKEEAIKQLHQIPVMCISESRELATAFLLKLEKDLLYYDMHNELLVVYSALKKINLYSEKYFHYSQLYNKHIAFSLSLEKTEEILGNFNRMLAQYNFSRSPKLLETLIFLRKGITEHYTLNPSRQVEIIKNIADIQLHLFCNIVPDSKFSTEELLYQTQKIITGLPDSAPNKSWMPAIDYLFFEYYFKTGHAQQSRLYFEKVNASLSTLLLYNYICLTSVFLISKICFLQEQGTIASLNEDDPQNFLFDQEDTHTRVLIGIYSAMRAYYAGSHKEAAAQLNELINLNSFKDYFHIYTDIKLALAYIYLVISEFDIADNIIKNITRKVKSEKPDSYLHVLDLVKVFTEELKKPNTKPGQKQKDFFALFMARNTNENKLLNYLVFELKNKYA